MPGRRGRFSPESTIRQGKACRFRKTTRGMLSGSMGCQKIAVSRGSERREVCRMSGHNGPYQGVWVQNWVQPQAGVG
jgi:hypothetical protein